MRKLSKDHDTWVIDPEVEITDLVKELTEGINDLRAKGYEVVSLNIDWSADFDLVDPPPAWTATITTLKPFDLYS